MKIDYYTTNCNPIKWEEYLYRASPEIREMRKDDLKGTFFEINKVILKRSELIKKKLESIESRKRINLEKKELAKKKTEFRKILEKKQESRSMKTDKTGYDLWVFSKEELEAINNVSIPIRKCAKMLKISVYRIQQMRKKIDQK